MPSEPAAPSKLLALILLMFSVAGCGGGSDAQPLSGPCVVNYLEPSLIISSVQSSTTAAPISVVSLSNITVNGAAFTPTSFPQGANVRPVGGTLECTVPCGFSVDEAALTLTVSAPGYIDRPLAATGSYAIRGGNGAGCPLELSGGNRIAVSLTPSP